MRIRYPIYNKRTQEMHRHGTLIPCSIIECNLLLHPHLHWEVTVVTLARAVYTSRGSSTYSNEAYYSLSGSMHRAYSKLNPCQRVADDPIQHDCHAIGKWGLKCARQMRGQSIHFLNRKRVFCMSRVFL